ncbi:MAG: alcohol dehydrogenase catalytic domain-containing protein [Gammaproteobacteria bacterium]|nr:alcohol dehydrogenase catalytic domain-containing protein [Gammaproteobacteria bacterium]
MRAAVFQKPTAMLTLADVPTPHCEGADLIVQVKCCGICGSDLHMADIHDRRGAMAPLPPGTIMGHEFCGEVVDIGPLAAKNWKMGERVTALRYIACGTCRACLNGMGYHCASVRYCGLGNLPGAYAEYIRVGAAETLRLTPGVDWQRGALVEPLTVALHAVEAARFTPGKNVLILGAGPIGLAVALWCRYFGAHHIIVSDKIPTRLALAHASRCDRNDQCGHRECD